jgi:hypothetical protein
MLLFPQVVKVLSFCAWDVTLVCIVSFEAMVVIDLLGRKLCKTQFQLRYIGSHWQGWKEIFEDQ